MVLVLNRYVHTSGGSLYDIMMICIKQVLSSNDIVHTGLNIMHSYLFSDSRALLLGGRLHELRKCQVMKMNSGRTQEKPDSKAAHHLDLKPGLALPVFPSPQIHFVLILGQRTHSTLT